MAEFQSIHFGTLNYDQQAIVEFPFGMPAFEDQRQFLIVEEDSTKPIVFLQSTTRPDLTFMALPVRVIDPDFQLNATAEDLTDLGLDPNRTPQDGVDILTLVLVTVRDTREATVNLMAPIVVNAKTRRAMQVIQPWSEYSHQHPLGTRPVRRAEMAAL